MPSLSPGQQDPSRLDFDSEEKAEDYIVSRMCADCQDQYFRAMNGTSEPDNPDHEFDSTFPACMCEWMTMPTEEFLECETAEDLMEAGGYELVYIKGDGVIK